jgi:hypothetical protein
MAEQTVNSSRVEIGNLQAATGDNPGVSQLMRLHRQKRRAQRLR